MLRKQLTLWMYILTQNCIFRKFLLHTTRSFIVDWRVFKFLVIINCINEGWMWNGLTNNLSGRNSSMYTNFEWDDWIPIEKIKGSPCRIIKSLLQLTKEINTLGFWVAAKRIKTWNMAIVNCMVIIGPKGYFSFGARNPLVNIALNLVQ